MAHTLAIPRARYEAQIARFEGPYGDAFEDALTRLVRRRGLGWFTDDQIAEIRDRMILDALSQRRRDARSRAAYAARRADA